MFSRNYVTITAAILGFALFAGCGKSPAYEKRNDITHKRHRLADNYLDERQGRRILYQDGQIVHEVGEPENPPDGKLDFVCTGHMEEPTYKCIFIVEKPEQARTPDGYWIIHEVRDSPEARKLQKDFNDVKNDFRGEN